MRDRILPCAHELTVGRGADGLGSHGIEFELQVVRGGGACRFLTG